MNPEELKLQFEGKQEAVKNSLQDCLNTMGSSDDFKTRRLTIFKNQHPFYSDNTDIETFSFGIDPKVNSARDLEQCGL
jgi:hypothetical protein